MTGPIEPSKWEQLEHEGHDVRWDVVQDPDLGTIASITVDGEIQYTAADDDLPRGQYGPTADYGEPS